MWSAGRSIVLCGLLTVYAALWFFLSLHSTRGALNATELPILKVDAKPGQAFAPADLDVVILAKPDDENRSIAISFAAPDSGFVRSSQQTLHGAEEMGQLASFTYRAVPAGSYILRVSLFNRHGKPRAVRDTTVRRIGRGDLDDAAGPPWPEASLGIFPVQPAIGMLGSRVEVRRGLRR